MKKISFVMTLLVAMLLLASCSKNKSANLIPEDAVIVMRLDVAKMQDQAGMNDKNSKLKKWMTEMIKDAGMPKKLRKMALDIIEDPTTSGIDFTEPLFFYVAGEDIQRKPDVGLVGAIASQSDLTKLVDEVTDLMGVDVEEADGGIKYVNAKDGVLAYSSDWFFFGTSFDIEGTIETLKERLDGKNTMADNKAFQKMCDKDGLMQFLFLGGGLENIIKSMPDMKVAMNEAMAAMPEDVKMEDMAYLSDLSLNSGELLLTSEVLPLSSAMKDYIDQYDKIVGSIGNEQARFVSGRFLNGFVNINVEEYLNIMKPWLKTQVGEEEMAMIEKVAKSLDGKLSAELYDITEDGRPQFNIYIGTKNSDALNLLVEQAGEELESDGPDQYLLPITTYDWEADSVIVTGYTALGFKNGQTYFVSDLAQAFTEPSDKFPTNQLKGKGCYIRFNFGVLNEFAKKADGEQRDLMNKVAGIYDFAEIYSDNGGKAIFRITTKSKKTNPVEALFKLIEEYI